MADLYFKYGSQVENIIELPENSVFKIVKNKKWNKNIKIDTIYNTDAPISIMDIYEEICKIKNENLDFYYKDKLICSVTTDNLNIEYSIGEKYIDSVLELAETLDLAE